MSGVVVKGMYFLILVITCTCRFEEKELKCSEIMRNYGTKEQKISQNPSCSEFPVKVKKTNIPTKETI